MRPELLELIKKANVFRTGDSGVRVEPYNTDKYNIKLQEQIKEIIQKSNKNSLNK